MGIGTNILCFTQCVLIFFKKLADVTKTELHEAEIKKTFHVKKILAAIETMRSTPGTTEVTLIVKHEVDGKPLNHRSKFSTNSLTNDTFLAKFAYRLNTTIDNINQITYTDPATNDRFVFNPKHDDILDLVKDNILKFHFVLSGNCSLLFC